MSDERRPDRKPRASSGVNPVDADTPRRGASGQAPRAASVDLERIRQVHLGDVPPEAARIVLLERVLRLAPSIESAGAELPQVQRTPPEGTRSVVVGRNDPSGDRAGARTGGGGSSRAPSWAIAGVGFGLAAAAGVALLFGADDGPGIHPEPTQAAKVRESDVVQPTRGPCTVARGNAGAVASFSEAVQIPPASYGPGGNMGPSAFAIPELDGRRGTWFHARNSVGEVGVPQGLSIAIPPGNGDERSLAINAAGPPPVGWGANFGVRFEPCYDASAYAGVEVTMRGSGVIFVGLQTLDSVPVEFGGRCTTRCWFTGGRHIALTDEFVTHRIRWEDVSPPSPSRGIPSELDQIMFSVQSGPEPYDIWVSELRFISQE